MNKLLFASHGHLASGIKSSLEIIAGKQNAVFIDAYMDGKNDFEEKVTDFIENCSRLDSIVLVSDMFGGSVNNVFMKYLNMSNVYVVCGMNLPLALELCLCSAPINIDLINEMVESARVSIKPCLLENEISEEQFYD